MTTEDTTRQRGLVIISALINFIDWLDREGKLTVPEAERGKLVMAFLSAHQDGTNYFMQAEQIAERLGAPLEDEAGRGRVVEKWTQAQLGDRVHVDNLLKSLPATHFYQMPPKTGPSYCDTPLSTFKCDLNELPYYTRIE